MACYVFSNVNEAFHQLVSVFARGSEEYPIVEEDSRNGPVLRFTEPVIVTYTNPMNRVLFNSARDCNPFFHVFESLWMLAGMQTVEPLAYFNSNIANYSDDGLKFHGAYGYRWRNHFGVDQLSCIIGNLRANPTCRRQVLQMWDAPSDLRRQEGMRDLPCNTHIYFAISGGKLDMTVCNRSNDLVWGMLGANVVHMSFLQQYMAEALGVEVGIYHQMTNNLHVYLNKWKPKEWLEWEESSECLGSKALECNGNEALLEAECKYARLMVEECKHTRLMAEEDEEKQKLFDLEVMDFCRGRDWDGPWHSPFLHWVARPMCLAFKYHKERNYELARRWVENIQDVDWQFVSRKWIEKRANNYEKTAGKNED